MFITTTVLFAYDRDAREGVHSLLAPDDNGGVRDAAVQSVCLHLPHSASQAILRATQHRHWQIRLLLHQGMHTC